MTPHQHTSPWQRILLVAAGLAVLGGAVWLHADREHHIERLHVALEEHGVLVRRPQLERQLDREVDPDRRQLEVARALVGDALDPAAWAQNVTTGTAEEGQDLVNRMSAKLAKARDLAADVRSRQPDSWRANLYLGAATYLSWAIQRDERLVREVETWQQPLERALELAPRHPEPKTFFTLTQLELWGMLSEERRERTRSLLGDAWTAGPVDQRILSAWLRVAPKTDSILEPLPDDPSLLRAARVELAGMQRWDLVIAARRQERKAVHARLERGLERAAAALRRGDVRGARSALGSSIPSTPDLELVEPMEELLAHLPAGPVPEVLAASLRPWLLWSLDTELYGVTTFSPPHLRRLAHLAAPEDTASRLRVELVLGGAREAERARLALDSRPDEDLTAYGIHLAAHHLLAELAAGLEGGRSEPTEITTDPRGSGGSLLDIASALIRTVPEPQKLTWRVARQSEPPTDILLGQWNQTRQGEYELEVWLPRAIDLLILPTGSVTNGGTAVEVQWNEQLLGTFQRFPRQSPLELVHSAAAGLHRLKIRNLGGVAFRPTDPEFER